MKPKELSAFGEPKTYWTPLASEKIRLTQIDDTHRSDHGALLPDDVCYFLFEYTSGKNYGYGAANSLISNLKKSPLLKARNDYVYKASAIVACGQHFTGAINKEWLKNATLVPVPSSKDPTHPEYDDRILQICRQVSAPFKVDVRELVRATQTIRAAHESTSRPTVEELLAVWTIDESLAEPAPEAIAVFDDVLTVGVHYRAMHRLLAKRFPSSKIFGFFVARRVFPPSDFSIN